MTAKVVLLTVLAGLLAGPAAADRVVRVGVFSAPPLVVVTGEKPQGLFIDLVDHFAAVGHWKVTYVKAPWGDQLKALERGELDLLPAIGFTQARLSVYDFSHDAVFIDSGVVFSSSHVSVHTLFDLQGKRVAALGTSVFTEAFRSNMKLFGLTCEILPMKDNESVMEAIAAGTADAGVTVYSLGTYLARRYPVSVTPISFSPLALEFAVPKGTGADLLATIDTEMASMRGDPSSPYSLAYKKWILPSDSGALTVGLLWTLGVLAVLGALALVWISALRRVVAGQTLSLREERNRLTVTLRSLAEGVITSDTLGQVQLMNPMAEQLTGWSQEEARGRPFGEVFVLGSDDAAHSAPLLVSKDGSQRRISTTEAPIRGDGGQVLGNVWTFRDVTDQERLAESLQRNDKLDSLGVLAGGIAHDFNNLLAGMFGFVDLAVHEDVGPRARAHLEKAKSVFQRAKGLTHQLLTFSRGGSPTKAPVDLSRLLKASAAFAGAGSNVRVELAVSDDLWVCEVDENQIGQVFDNLIINARQAMPAGGVLKIAAQNVEAQSPSVAVTFEDEGTGIPADIQPKIFDPFFTTKPSGHGLGLATARSIASKHGGSLELVASSSRGTRFRLLLPALPMTLVHQKKLLGTPPTGEGLIAVMDDEEFLRDILAGLLSGLGFEVVTAASGGELLQRFEDDPSLRRRLRAAFLDLTIPGGLGGLETVPRLKALVPQVPIFASSGFSEDPVMAQPTAYGFTASIRKPFSREELYRLVDERLSRDKS